MAENPVVRPISKISDGDNVFEFKDEKAREHMEQSVVSEEGVHGIRYYNESFQGYDEEAELWFDIQGSGGSVALDDVSDAEVTLNRTSASFIWIDPDDVVASDVILARWEGTLVVRKEGSAPRNRNDGTVIIDSKIRDAYSSTALVDNNLEYGKVYYYRFFPYASGKYTNGTSLRVEPTRETISAVPSQSGTVIYSGSSQEPSWSGYDSTKMTISGDTSGTNVDTYTVTFTPKSDYQWSDGTTEAKTVTWSISKKSVSVPSVTNTSKTYNRSSQEPTTSSYDTGDILATGGLNATDVGDYTITFSLRDTNNTEWSDGTVTDKTASWSISPKSVAIPTLSNKSKTYSGSSQSPTISSYDSNEVTVSGNASATNYGTYTVKFNLTSATNYVWSDGTTSEKSDTWNIAKAAGAATLSATSVTLNSSNTSRTVTVSGATGTVTVSSNNTAVATASISGSTITISSPSSANGSATITVNIAEGSNNLATSKTISVTADFLKIVSWANGTDAEICAMVEAARKGQINLQSYWNVGDERKVTLGAMAATGVGESNASQEVTLVLSHKGGQELVTAAKNTSGGTRTECSFQVDMKNSLITAGYMNNTDTNSGSWGESKRRAWCNNIFYNAIPSSLRPIFAQFKCKTAKTYNGTEIETTNDYFALRAAKEIFGGSASSAGSGTSYSNLTEFNALTQVDWYKTASHRVKKLGGNASEQSSGGSYWWERSPYYGSAASFCGVNLNGTASSSSASNAYGLSPFGCIN